MIKKYKEIAKSFVLCRTDGQSTAFPLKGQHKNYKTNVI